MTRPEPDAASSDVRLRTVAQDDLPAFFEHQLDPLANLMAAFPARDRDALPRHWVRILADETVVARTILVDGEVAGNVVSFEQAGKRQVGYWLGRSYWVKGVATRAMSQFLHLVEERPLLAYVARHNIASIRVLEKCGFTVVAENGEVSDEEGEEYLMELRA